MHVDVVWLTAALLSFPLLTLGDPLYIMLAPQILRVGTTERVFVQVLNYNNGQNPLPVQITVRNFPSRQTDLFKYKVTLDSTNTFQSLVDIQIPYLEDHFNSDSEEKQFVYLRASFPHSYVEKLVMVSFQSGYIFLQTDKTIYTPDSTVKYRVFALNTGVKPLREPVVIKIMTPDGIAISQKTHYGNLKIEEYKLGSPISYGIWKIAASFKNNPRKNFTVEFEVKEYVLPSFEVKLTLAESFYYIDDEEFSVEISARYLFGRDVQGSAFVVFGVFSEGKKISIQSSLQRVQIYNGKGTAKVTRNQILETFPKQAKPIGKTLYISVRVLTETGSEIVEAEKRGIYIVESPYVIKFTRTPKFFKPGLPFVLMVSVANPDGTPAKGVLMSVTSTNTKVVTNENGLAQFIINTEKTKKSLDISVRTEAEKLTEERQAKKQMRVQASTSKSTNYLHIDIRNRELKVGESVTVKLNFVDSSEVKQVITLLILSKGHIVHALREQRHENNVLAMMLPITKDMVPSFRVVAYYHVGSSEIVADSIWVDIKDTCMGTLQVTKQGTDALKPNDELRLVIKGNAGANVSLVAVDKGIYVLNNRSRLTQAKIWDIVEKHDIACTAGSGKDSMGVFYDAGLLFASNSAGSTNDRRDFSCPSEPTRRRRELRRTIVDTYNQTLRQCCADGMVENLLGYTCERRAEYVEDGVECREAFLHCCQKLAKLKAADMMQEELRLGRNDEIEFEVDPEDHSDDQSRSVFPDSWMMEDIVLPACKVNEMCADISDIWSEFLPDSITTWVISAISMSEDYGICVADPYEVKVTKDLFIDLRLPYTAVVNEQIEIKAVIHNLSNRLEKVYVLLKETETICSLASYKRKYQTSVRIDSKSSQAVSFVIIPLVVGEFDIEVKISASGGRDGVLKTLKVVSQGVPTSTEETTLVLEPKHGRDEKSKFQRPLLKNQMPDTEAHTYIAVTGQPLAQLINDAVSGKGLDKLISEPSGCGEQNLLRMVLPLIATYYLDKTNKWNDVGVDQRTKALSYIYTGYTNELGYRKPDHSFGSFMSTPGSTWLTAYVVRMFSMASDVVTINVDVICNAIKWLILKAQMPNGVFREVCYLSSNAMGGKYSEFTMTAYVLIALQDGKRICGKSVTSLENSMNKAVNYIDNNIDSTSDPYAVAMASYALANEGKLKDSVLLQFASEDGSHWPVNNGHLFTLEATGYALLSLVKAGKFSRTLSIVKWLKSNQRFQGGYESTQATAVVFEALAKYTAAKPPTFEGELKVAIQSTLRKTPVNVLFTKSDRGLQRSRRFKAEGDLEVTASGQGEVTIRVVTRYYIKPDKNTTTCSNFELDVKMTQDTACKEVPNCYKLTIDIKFLDEERDATMTILDVGMLTGFVPDMIDLKKLKGQGQEKYIEEFEMDSQLSERGSLIIYLKKVSHKRKETIAFRVNQKINTGVPQPTAVSVYEYYNTENRCTKFYDASTERSSGLLYKLCPKDVCTCAEESCPRLKNVDPNKNNRSDEACSHRDYVYKGTLKEVKSSGNVNNYTFFIVDVLKHGTDQEVANQMRNFLMHYRCSSKISLVKDSSYLLMGPEPQKVGTSYDYILGVRSWIEYWPTVEEGKKDKNANLTYTDLAAFNLTFFERGCMT